MIVVVRARVGTGDGRRRPAPVVAPLADSFHALRRDDHPGNLPQTRRDEQLRLRDYLLRVCPELNLQLWVGAHQLQEQRFAEAHELDRGVRHGGDQPLLPVQHERGVSDEVALLALLDRDGLVEALTLCDVELSHRPLSHPPDHARVLARGEDDGARAVPALGEVLVDRRERLDAHAELDLKLLSELPAHLPAKLPEIVRLVLRGGRRLRLLFEPVRDFAALDNSHLHVAQRRHRRGPHVTVQEQVHLTQQIPRAHVPRPPPSGDFTQTRQVDAPLNEYLRGSLLDVIRLRRLVALREEHRTFLDRPSLSFPAC